MSGSAKRKPSKPRTQPAPRPQPQPKPVIVKLRATYHENPHGRPGEPRNRVHEIVALVNIASVEDGVIDFEQVETQVKALLEPHKTLRGAFHLQWAILAPTQDSLLWEEVTPPRPEIYPDQHWTVFRQHGHGINPEVVRDESPEPFMVSDER